MSKMIQIRNVPDPIHRALKARASLAGMSLSEYLLGEVKRSLEQPTRQEILARIAKWPPVEVDISPAEMVRRERDSR